MAHRATSGGKKTRTTHTLNRHTLTRRAPIAETSRNVASCVLQTTTARSQLNALDETLRLAWRAKPCFTPVALALADGRKQNLSYLLHQVNTECSPLGRARRSHLLGSSDAIASQHLSLPRTEIQKFTSLSSRPLHPFPSTRTASLVQRQSSLSQHDMPRQQGSTRRGTLE